MAGGESARGREKQISSPNGEQRKKKGSLFRRASLSRKKNKEEQRQRSKSKALGFFSLSSISESCHFSGNRYFSGNRKFPSQVSFSLMVFSELIVANGNNF